MGKNILGNVSVASSNDIVSVSQSLSREMRDSITSIRSELQQMELLINQDKIDSIEAALASLRNSIANIESTTASIESRVVVLENTCANTALTSAEVREEYERW